MQRSCFIAFLYVLITSCHFSAGERNGDHVKINVQPFSGISESETKYVFEELKKVYPYVILNKTIAFPSTAFYSERNKYRTDSLIKFIGAATASGHVTIGLTNKDISTTKDSVADWGVMGLGFRPGNACIASSFRLSKTEKLVQFFKVAIHELGHTQGLPHCEVKTCFMRDAEGKNPANEEKGFCNPCKSVLVSKGWKL